MKLVVAVTLAIGMLMALSAYDFHHAAKTKAQSAALFGCQAPTTEGQITMITIDVRDGKLFGDCQYASTRPSKPKKGG